MGIISYLVMVLPTLGLVAMSIHRYQRVADHLVYPALLPLIAIAVGAAARAMATCRNEKLIKTAVALAVAIALFYPTYQRAESFSDGLRLWKRDLSIWPGSWGALNELGFVYAQLAMDLQRQGEQGKAEGAYRTAAGHFSESVRIRPDFLNAWMNLGNAQSALMRFETATNHEKEAEELFSASVASYRKALELFPGSVKSRLNLALLYMEKERFAEAVPELRILAKADPKEWPPRLLLGVALVRQSSRTNDSALSPESAALSREAAGLLEQVTREAPDNAEAWLNLCIANYNQMNLAKAHDACVEALRLSPEDGEARLYLGLVLKETGKKEKAPGR
jgi:tetratricopeptide (TPR) repeat protein